MSAEWVCGWWGGTGADGRRGFAVKDDADELAHQKRLEGYEVDVEYVEYSDVEFVGREAWLPVDRCPWCDEIHCECADL